MNLHFGALFYQYKNKIISLLFFITFSQFTLASHVAGGKFEYKYIGSSSGNYQYEVKYFHYTPCGTGNPALFSPGLANQTLISTIPIVNEPYRLESFCWLEKADHSIRYDLGPQLYYISSSILPEDCACENGNLAGYKEYVFKGNINIPIPSPQSGSNPPDHEDWNFILQNNARFYCNSVPSSPYQPFCVTSHLSLPVPSLNSSTPNSSVSLSNPIFIFPLLNQPFTYNFGAVETDGDVLIYKFVEPKNSATTPITYALPYSVTHPFGPYSYAASPSTLLIDRYTGTITGNAVAYQTIMVAVEISERDKTDTSIVKGTVTADFVLKIFNGNNVNPDLSGINGNTGQFTIQMYVGNSSCFTINGSDQNADLVELSSSDLLNVIPTSAINVINNNTTTPVAQICWTPETLDVDKTFCFTLKAVDNACSNPNVSPQTYNGITIQNYCIKVNPNPCCQVPEVTVKDQSLENPVEIPITANNSNSANILSFCKGASLKFEDHNPICSGENHIIWVIDGQNSLPASSIVASFANPGLHVVKLNLNDQCVVDYWINIIDCQLPCKDCIPSFSPEPGKDYLLSAWTKQENYAPSVTNFTRPKISLIATVPGPSNTITYPILGAFFPSGEIIDGWQRVEGQFSIPANSTYLKIELECITPEYESSFDCYFDDIRIHPMESNMKSYVYDPYTLRLSAELDENNYATFYEYDEEGKLIRLKKETEKGVMTIQENRNNTKKN